MSLICKRWVLLSDNFCTVILIQESNRQCYSFLWVCLLLSCRAFFPFLDFPSKSSLWTWTRHIRHTCLKSAVSQWKLPSSTKTCNAVWKTKHDLCCSLFYPGPVMDSKVFTCASAADLQKWMQHAEDRRYKAMMQPMSPSHCALSYLVLTNCCTASGYNCTKVL